MEPAPPQLRPSTLLVPGAPWGRAVWRARLSSRPEMEGKRGTRSVLRWKPGILQLQPHAIPTSGVMSSGFPAGDALLCFEVVSLGGPSPEPALGFGSLYIREEPRQGAWWAGPAHPNFCLCWCAPLESCTNSCFGEIIWVFQICRIL